MNEPAVFGTNEEKYFWVFHLKKKDLIFNLKSNLDLSTGQKIEIIHGHLNALIMNMKMLE